MYQSRHSPSGLERVEAQYYCMPSCGRFKYKRGANIGSKDEATDAISRDGSPPSSKLDKDIEWI